MQRICGTETEWAVMVPAPQNASEVIRENGCIEQADAEFTYLLRRYLQKRPHAGGSNNYFLENGGRLYIDAGHKKETTTPEDTSYEGVTISEIANERILLDILKPLEEKHSQDDKGSEDTPYRPRFSLNKRAIDDDGNGSGYHENYNVPANIDINEEGLAILGVHLATRNIFAGSGFLGKNGKFYSAQKALTLYHNFSSSSTQNRPVIHSRNESLSNAASKRVHVICGDPSMSPWSTRMQLGTTSIVLELMAEEKIRYDQLGFVTSDTTSGLATFIRKLAGDSSGRRQEFNTALEIQKRLVASARTLSLTTDQEWVVDQWDKVCADLSKDITLTMDRVEWVLRKHMLEKYRNKHGLQNDSLLMRNRDRQWDKIDPRVSIGLKLRESIWSKWMPSEELIELRRTTAPETTRAQIRSRFIKAFSGLHPLIADWVVLKCEELNKTINIKDPYETISGSLEEFILEHGRTEAAAA